MPQTFINQNEGQTFNEVNSNIYNMYNGLLHLHSGLRWLILTVLIIVLVKYSIAWIKNKSWKKTDNVLGIVLSASMDLQLLSGLIIYFFYSPITKTALNDFGAAMKNADLRFYAVEHFLMMILAVVFIHIGRSRSKRAMSDKHKFKKALFWVLLATIFILAGIPWGRM